jgi:hypothetical protein
MKDIAAQLAITEKTVVLLLTEKKQGFYRGKKTQCMEMTPQEALSLAQELTSKARIVISRKENPNASNT